MTNQKTKIYTMVGVLMAMLLSALDQTIVSTAMPEIVRELNGLEHLSWVFTAYMLASTVTVPIYGKLSDIFGRRGLYLAGIVIFLLASALAGQSQSMAQLIAFRALQGIGGGAIMVNSFAIIGDLFSPAERGRWQGVMGGVFGLASILGPFLGGWLTDNLSWHWIFYVNLPIGLLAIAVIASTLPKIKPDTSSRSIDYWGALTIAGGLVSLLLALVWGGNQYAWNSREILSLFGAATVAFGLFAFAETKAKEPILPLDLFRNQTFLVSGLVTFLTALGMFGAIVYLPLFAQSVVGFSATNSGLALFPLMAGLITASAISGQIISKTGQYKWLAVTGMVITVLGTYLLSQLSADTTKLRLTIDMIVMGLGLGVTFPIFTIVVQNAFPHQRLGVVTAATQLFRSIGGTVGVAIMGGVMNNALAQRLTTIGDQPFVQSLARIAPQAAPQTINANALQGFLSPAGHEQLTQLLAAAPAALQPQLTSQLTAFTEVLKQALAGSIGELFAVSTWLMASALVVVLFLPQLKLRRTNRGAAQEAGMELEAELGQSDAGHEPDLTGDESEETEAEARLTTK